MSKEQYDRTVAYIRQLQAKSTTWSVELYNCNAFVADIAKFMGLRVPSSSWIYPKVFVSNMRKVNTGHPEAANELVSENVKEMNNPTRDGRAMINAGLIRPGSAPAGSASPPHVTIGAVRVSSSTGEFGRPFTRGMSEAVCLISDLGPSRPPDHWRVGE